MIKTAFRTMAYGWVKESPTTPQPAVLIGAPRNFSPSTAGTVASDVVRVHIGSAADFAKYAGSQSCRECHAKEFDAWSRLAAPEDLAEDVPGGTHAARFSHRAARRAVPGLC